MTSYSISQLAKRFGLSRSTLLYYDRIGLLKAAQRTPSGYRRYTETDSKKLERITTLRGAGLQLSVIKEMIDDELNPGAEILERRLKELSGEILTLRAQQHLVAAMLKNVACTAVEPPIDKKAWVEMLKAAGMDEAAMKTWHIEFEKRSSSAHLDFLLSLGISIDEVKSIQAWSKEAESFLTT